MLLRAVELYRGDVSADAELFRDGTALRVGEKGPRVLRLCIDPCKCSQSLLSV